MKYVHVYTYTYAHVLVYNNTYIYATAGVKEYIHIYAYTYTYILSAKNVGNAAAGASGAFGSMVGAYEIWRNMP
jgi:hypothetical protein